MPLAARTELTPVPWYPCRPSNSAVASSRRSRVFFEAMVSACRLDVSILARALTISPDIHLDWRDLSRDAREVSPEHTERAHVTRSPFLPHGRFDATARRTIVERLSSGVLAAEGLPETPNTRAMTSVVIEESAPTAWSVAADPVENRKQLHAFVRITTFASLLDPQKRAAMLAAANSAILDVAGGAPLGGLGIWVVIDEIADGRWGVAGRPIGLAELQAFTASASR